MTREVSGLEEIFKLQFISYAFADYCGNHFS